LCVFAVMFQCCSPHFALIPFSFASNLCQCADAPSIASYLLLSFVSWYCVISFALVFLCLSVRFHCLLLLLASITYLARQLSMAWRERFWNKSGSDFPVFSTVATFTLSQHHLSILGTLLQFFLTTRWLGSRCRTSGHSFVAPFIGGFRAIYGRNCEIVQIGRKSEQRTQKPQLSQDLSCNHITEPKWALNRWRNSVTCDGEEKNIISASSEIRRRWNDLADQEVGFLKPSPKIFTACDS